MRIEWLGHSCFRLRAASGATLITDPFHEAVGYPLPKGHADVVTISHAHSDHNYLGQIEADTVVCGDEAQAAGYTIRAIHTFHDEEQGQKRGENRVYCLEADGLRCLHLGDLGHSLSAEAIQAIGPIDILFVPVGGFYTIDAKTAWSVTQALRPKLAIPMHFLTPYIHFPIADETEFQSLAGGTVAKEAFFNVMPETLPQTLTVLVPRLCNG